MVECALRDEAWGPVQYHRHRDALAAEIEGNLLQFAAVGQILRKRRCDCVVERTGNAGFERGVTRRQPQHFG
jgi:hypothetical protein